MTHWQLTKINARWAFSMMFLTWALQLMSKEMSNECVQAFVSITKEAQKTAKWLDDERGKL